MFEETNQTEVAEAETTALQEEGLLPFDLFERQEEDEGAARLTVKYNGEEKQITLDEARTLAQKGMNYDHIYAEHRDAHRALDTIAAREGINRAQLMERLSGVDLHTLRWGGLLKAYPDLEVKDIPDEVFHAVRDGKSPTEAYQEYLICDLSRKLSQKESLRESSRKTIGSLKGAGEEVMDEFLQGFYGKKY